MRIPTRDERMAYARSPEPSELDLRRLRQTIEAVLGERAALAASYGEAVTIAGEERERMILAVAGRAQKG